MARKGAKGGRGGGQGQRRGRSDARERFMNSGSALELLQDGAPTPAQHARAVAAKKAREDKGAATALPQGPAKGQKDKAKGQKAAAAEAAAEAAAPVDLSKGQARRNALRESVKHAPIQVGKAGLSDTLCRRVDEYLERNEVVKVKVLDTSPHDIDDVAADLSEQLGAQVVLRVGRVLTLERARLVAGERRRAAGPKRSQDPRIFEKQVLWEVELPYDRFAEMGDEAPEDEEGDLQTALQTDGRTVTHEIEGGRHVHEIGDGRDTDGARSLKDMFSDTPWLTIVEEDGSIESRF